MTLHYIHEPVFKANASDVENFIKEILGQRFDIVDDQGGAEYVVEVDVVDTGIDLDDEGRIVLWQNRDYSSAYSWGDLLLEPILSQLSQMGHMPAGTWYIRIE